MKHAYIIGHITIKNEDKWIEYRNKIPATLEPWGAELVFRGKIQSVFAGSHSHTDTVVIRFPDLRSANSWFSSPEYQAIIPLRQQAAEVDLLSFEES